MPRAKCMCEATNESNKHPHEAWKKTPLETSEALLRACIASLNAADICPSMIREFFALALLS